MGFAARLCQHVMLRVFFVERTQAMACEHTKTQWCLLLQPITMEEALQSSCAIGAGGRIQTFQQLAVMMIKQQIITINSDPSCAKTAMSLNAARAPNTTRFLKCFSLLVFVATVSTLLVPAVGQAALGQNAVVGEVFDQPVYRVELRHDEADGNALADLQQRILGPVLQEYRMAFRQLFEPRTYELQAALSHLQTMHADYLASESLAISERLALIESQLAQPELATMARENLLAKRASLVASLTPPDLDHVWALVTYWKFQRHVYDVYGGGRVVLKAYGPEAIDATANWLKLRELEGDFVIHDPALRDAFYAQWSEASVAVTVVESGQDAEGLAAEAAEIAKQMSYERNRYRLLNPDWMRALYKSILDVQAGDAAAAIDMP